MYGYTVVDTISVLATHLTEIIHAYAHELLNRQEAQGLVDNAKTYASAVVEELIPGQLNLGQVLKVLQNLLKERIPIRDIVSILEILADHSVQTKEVEVLTEYVRHGLARTITRKYQMDDEKLYAITLDPKVEQMMGESLQRNEFGARLVLRPTTITKILEQLNELVQAKSEEGVQPVLLTNTALRPHLRELIERALPRLPVVSFNEIVPDIEIVACGSLDAEVLG